MSIFKKIISISMIGILSIGLTACSNKGNISSKKYLSVEEIKQAIIKDELLTIQPIIETPATEHSLLEPVKDKIEEGVVIQSSNDNSLQDVIIVKANNKEDAEIVESELETYITYLKNESPFQDGYGGDVNEESAATATLGIKGKYVYLIAAPTLFDIEDKILSFIK